MSPLNASNVDSQGIKYELALATKTAKIVGTQNNTLTSYTIKRGVEDTSGNIYKVTQMNDTAFQNANCTQITFSHHKSNEFDYKTSGFNRSICRNLIFKDKTIKLIPPTQYITLNINNGQTIITPTYVKQGSKDDNFTNATVYDYAIATITGTGVVDNAIIVNNTSNENWNVYFTLKNCKAQYHVNWAASIAQNTSNVTTNIYITVDGENLIESDNHAAFGGETHGKINFYLSGASTTSSTLTLISHTGSAIIPGHQTIYINSDSTCEEFLTSNLIEGYSDLEDKYMNRGYAYRDTHKRLIIKLKKD